MFGGPLVITAVYFILFYVVILPLWSECERNQNNLFDDRHLGCCYKVLKRYYGEISKAYACSIKIMTSPGLQLLLFSITILTAILIPGMSEKNVLMVVTSNQCLACLTNSQNLYYI